MPAKKIIKNQPCVFLDRDGCVIQESGYLNHPDNIRLIRGVAHAIKRLNDAGILAILTTNQAGVARGYFDESVLAKIHDRLQEKLSDKGARLDAMLYCPYHPDGSVKKYTRKSKLRKPAIGMIQKAQKQFGIDLKRSYTIGDKITDVEFGHNAGCKGIFVLTGYGKGEYEYNREAWKSEPDRIAKNLPQAVDWILDDLDISESATVHF